MSISFYNPTILSRQPHFTVTARAVAATAFSMLPVASARDAVPTRGDIAERHGKVKFSPCAGRNFPTKVFWGDQHLHTEVPVDAGALCQNPVDLWKALVTSMATAETKFKP